MIRLDFEESLGEVGGFDGEALASHYAQALNRCEVVVLSDYGKGTLRDVASLIRAARAPGKRVLVDPKGQDWQRHRGATLLTPNPSAFATIVGICRDDDDKIGRRTRRAMVATEG